MQGRNVDNRSTRGETIDPFLLQDNYIPAAMQVIFYLTDSMKYDLRPLNTPVTSTTVRPTPPHKPGYYAPEKPPGAGNYLTRTFLRQEPLRFGKEAIPGDLGLLGSGPVDLLHQINSLGDSDTIGDEDVDVLRFAINYDDALNVDFLKQKRVPPTRAYVTLLSLYDLMNKEAKEKGLSKYGVSRW